MTTASVPVQEKPPLAVPPAKSPEAKTAGSKKRTDLPPLPAYIENTLGERGPELPIGFKTEKGQVRHLEFRNWTTKLEKEVSKRLKGKRTMGVHVPHLLAHMVKVIGPHTWDDSVSLEDRKAVLSGMHSGDIFYAYAYLRREALGDELALKITCPACETKFKFPADLDTLEVRGVESEKDLDWFYPLLNPIDIRNKRVTKLRVGSPSWRLIEATTNTASVEQGKILSVRMSINGLNDEADHVILAEDELDELSKRDLEWLVSEINERFVGPKMSVELDCPNTSCKLHMSQVIPWGYDDFFTISSR